MLQASGDGAAKREIHDLLTAVFALPDLADVATLPEMQVLSKISKLGKLFQFSVIQ